MADRVGMGAIEALLKEKITLLERILEETDRQRALLDAEDTEGLSASIAARKATMDMVDEVDKRIQKLGGASQSPEDLTAAVRALLQKIIEEDNRNRVKAGELTRKLVSGIRETNAEKNLQAYSQSLGPANLYVNRKG